MVILHKFKLKTDEKKWVLLYCDKTPLYTGGIMKLFNLIFVMLFLLISLDLTAGSKRTNVDLDVKTTEIVRVELDVDDHYYYIDPTACICWVSRLIGGSNSTSTFDCSKLLAYSKLESHLKKCKKVKKEPSVVNVIKEDALVVEPQAADESNKTKDKKQDIKK